MECKVISLAEFRKTRKAQARILKRLIERHLTEAGRILSPPAKDLVEVPRSLRESSEE
jgi:hypothetical protein